MASYDEASIVQDRSHTPTNSDVRHLAARSGPQRKLAELAERFKDRAGEARMVESVQPVQLPLWSEVERAIPNHIARSSLFAPIQRGKRSMHDKAKLASRCDVTIFYTGKQLDEADCDVFMQALHEARNVALGQPVIIIRAEFLRAIGRQKSGDAYNWLHQSFERLFLAAIQIEAKRYNIGTSPRSKAMHLISGFDFEPDLDRYVLSIDPRMLVLFSNSEFALLDWEKRMRIEKRAALSKFLQRLIATSNDKVQRHALVELKERACYESPMRKFKEAIREAMQELERVGIIAGGKIGLSTRGKEQTVWTRLA